MTESKSRTSTAVRRRPAESAGAAGGLAGLITALAAGDRITVLVALSGFVPAAVSFLVDRGGVRGLLRALWAGPAPAPEGDTGD